MTLRKPPMSWRVSEAGSRAMARLLRAVSR